MSAQVTATAPPLSNDLANYNNRWDAYGGFGYARFQTTLGVNLKTNMYGWKGQVTGWLNPIVGITAATGNYYGTVSLPPNEYDLKQANISEHLFLFGPEVRLLRDPKWTVDAHVLLGRYLRNLQQLLPERSRAERPASLQQPAGLCDGGGRIV